VERGEPIVRVAANVLDIFLAAFFSVQYFVPITLYQSDDNNRVYIGGRLVTVSGLRIGQSGVAEGIEMPGVCCHLDVSFYLFCNLGLLD